MTPELERGSESPQNLGMTKVKWNGFGHLDNRTE